eukprot:SAG11_NODE_6452_length_1310_cov_2.411230_1_plen_299_part_00
MHTAVLRNRKTYSRYLKKIPPSDFFLLICATQYPGRGILQLIIIVRSRSMAAAHSKKRKGGPEPDASAVSSYLSLLSENSGVDVSDRAIWEDDGSLGQEAAALLPTAQAPVLPGSIPDPLDSSSVGESGSSFGGDDCSVDFSDDEQEQTRRRNAEAQKKRNAEAQKRYRERNKQRGDTLKQQNAKLQQRITSLEAEVQDREQLKSGLEKAREEIVVTQQELNLLKRERRMAGSRAEPMDGVAIGGHSGYKEVVRGLVEAIRKTMSEVESSGDGTPTQEQSRVLRERVEGIETVARIAP